MSTVRKVTSDTGRAACRPKSGGLFCVMGRHADGKLAHRHFKTEALAKNYRRELDAEHIGAQRAESRPRATTFREQAERWRQAQDPADPNSIRFALNRAYTLIGGVRLAGIDNLVLSRLQKDLRATYAASTVELTMVYVNAVCRAAHLAGLIPGNDPTAGMARLRRDPRDRSGIVTADEIPSHAEALAILAASLPRYRLGVALGLGCGLRVGEVLGLTPGYVDLAAGTITIAQQRAQRGMVSPKTWRGVRTIEVPDLVRVELRRALRDSPPKDLPILAGGRSGVLRRDGWYEQAWRPALVAAGLGPGRYKFHACRHYAVSAMLGQGVPLAEVAQYIGDAPETVIKVYTHFISDAPKAAKLALDRALAPPPELPAANANL